MTTDMSKYLGLFVSEATEHLEALAQDLIRVEKAPDPASIDSMFRHAHSLKGMAASMGYDHTAAIAHRMEDLVQAIRADASVLTRETVDLLLVAADALLGQVRAAGEGGPVDEATAVEAQLAARLTALTHSGRTADQPSAKAQLAAPPKPSLVASGARTRGPRFEIRIRIAAGCKSPGPRAFLAIKRLTKLGNIFELSPAMEEIRQGRIPGGAFSLELETAAGEGDVRSALENVPELEDMSVIALEGMVAHLPEPARAAEQAPAPPPKDPVKMVRIRTEMLDYFLDTVGELILATSQIRETGKTLPTQLRPRLEEGVDRLHGLVKDLHDKVMSARMTPLSTLTERLPRPARDIARKRGREVDLVVTGAEVELDRTIVESLSDPVLHIVRNCIDHGIESPEERSLAGKGASGRILIDVRRARDRVVVQIEDDGRGMDEDKLRTAAVERGFLTREAVQRLSDKEVFLLSCLPGLSTAQGVSDISGRGVGMDAVKRALEEVGGTLEIDSKRGRGTRFTLHLPLTVSVVNLMLVGVGEEIVGVPVVKVLSALELDSDALTSGAEGTLLPHSRALLPVRELSEVLGLPVSPRAGVRPYLVMEAESGKVALAVDKLLGQEEVVLKALSRPLDLIPGLSGVTILGTGRPVFILDVPRLLAP